MSKESHSFSVDVAVQIGIPPAIILKHLIYCQRADATATTPPAKIWVRRTVASFLRLYPYLGGKQIRLALDTLEEKGLLRSKIDNRDPGDRAKSFNVTMAGFAIYGIQRKEVQEPYIAQSRPQAEAEPAPKKKGEQPSESPDFSGWDRPDEASRLWAEWIEYRIKTNRPLRPVSYKAALKRFQTMAGGIVEVGAEIIEFSIGAGYQAMVRPKASTIKTSTNGKPQQRNSRANGFNDAANPDAIRELLAERHPDRFSTT